MLATYFFWRIFQTLPPAVSVVGLRPLDPLVLDFNVNS